MRTILIAMLVLVVSGLAAEMPDEGFMWGDWYVGVDTDPITDEAIILVMIPEKSGEGRYFVMRLLNGVTNVLISWNDYLGDNSIVTMRLDKLEPETQEWNISETSTATFYPDDPEVLIWKLQMHKQVVCRITPYSSTAVTAIFDLSGLSDLIAEYPEELKSWMPPADWTEFPKEDTNAW